MDKRTFINTNGQPDIQIKGHTATPKENLTKTNGQTATAIVNLLLRHTDIQPRQRTV
jgi:hypothetical protein